MMYCRICEMREKEVINITNGERLGCVGDVEFDTFTGQIICIIIFAKKWFGLFGKNEDVVIYWNDIQVIGDDTILVSMNSYADDAKRTASQKLLEN